MMIVLWFFFWRGSLSCERSYFWVSENPRWMMRYRTQNPKKVNVWCDIMDEPILKLHFFEVRLTGARYLDFFDTTFYINNFVSRTSLPAGWCTYPLCSTSSYLFWWGFPQSLDKKKRGDWMTPEEYFQRWYISKTIRKLLTIFRKNLSSFLATVR